MTRADGRLRPTREKRAFRRFFADLGPGLITGAADDDPSGISTYSVAGASFGFLPLWTAILSFPLMVSVQLMCARLGLVTGYGLAGVIRRWYPTWVLIGACLLLIVANTVNIAADLAGMADATRMVTGLPTALWVAVYSIAMVSLLFWSSYRLIAKSFKWLTLVLASYVVTAFITRVDWPAALRATFVPHLEWSRAYLSILVAILGTTISPYLFFWQAAEEVEEERAMGRNLKERRGATADELAAARTDVITGMFVSQAIMYFIVLTTGATLHAHGHTNITTAQEAAQALRPLGGAAAYWLFTLGLIGTGMLSVPVLAGSCAYAIAEARAWRGGSLNRKPGRAKKFYSVIAVAMALGIGLDFFGFNAIRMLFISAVINGVLAPPLILLVILLTRDPRVMREDVNPPLLNFLGWATFAVMSIAAIGMFVVS